MQKIFPIWGTCLGFETLLMLTRGSIDILDRCHGYNYATELTITPGTEFCFAIYCFISNFYLRIDAADSRLLGATLPLNIKNSLVNEPTTANFHEYCMRPEVNIFIILFY
jgi:hypothetical protein